MGNLLETINSPEDLKKLPAVRLIGLAQEIRDEIPLDAQRLLLALPCHALAEVLQLRPGPLRHLQVLVALGFRLFERDGRHHVFLGGVRRVGHSVAADDEEVAATQRGFDNREFTVRKDAQQWAAGRQAMTDETWVDLGREIQDEIISRCEHRAA